MLCGKCLRSALLLCVCVVCKASCISICSHSTCYVTESLVSSSAPWPRHANSPFPAGNILTGISEPSPDWFRYHILTILYWFPDTVTNSAFLLLFHRYVWTLSRLGYQRHGEKVFGTRIHLLFGKTLDVRTQPLIRKHELKRVWKALGPDGALTPLVKLRDQEAGESISIQKSLTHPAHSTC